MNGIWHAFGVARGKGLPSAAVYKSSRSLGAKFCKIMPAETRSDTVNATSATHSVQRPRALAILWGGVIAGAFDLTYATVFYSFRGVKPIRVSQSIASGLLGPKAYEGGVATAILGVVLHFVIAMGAATVFYLVSRKLTFLTQKPILGVHCMALRSIFSCISWYCRWRRIRDSEPRRFRSPRFLT